MVDGLEASFDAHAIPLADQFERYVLDRRRPHWPHFNHS